MNSEDVLTHYDSTIRRFNQNYIEQDIDRNYLRLELDGFIDYTENDIFRKLSRELNPQEKCLICDRELDQIMIQVYCMFCGNNYCQSHFIKKRKFRDNVTNICMICEQKYVANVVAITRTNHHNHIRTQIQKLQQNQEQLVQQLTVQKQDQVMSKQQVEQLKSEVDDLQNQSRLYLTMNNQYQMMIQQYKVNIETTFRIREQFESDIQRIQLEEQGIKQKMKELQVSSSSLEDNEQQIQKVIQSCKQQSVNENMTKSYNDQFNNLMKHSDSQMKTEPLDDQKLVIQQFQNMQETGNRRKYKKNHRINYGVTVCKPCQIQ